MKKLLLPACITSAVLCACNNPPTESAGSGKKITMPKPGAVVAEAHMPINDPPRNFTFSVKVIADSNMAAGEYYIDADYGPNFNEGHLVMPKGGESFLPIIKKANEPNAFIIGFKMPGDTTFYEYFEVSTDKHATKMQYTKAYSF